MSSFLLQGEKKAPFDRNDDVRKPQPLKLPNALSKRRSMLHPLLTAPSLNNDVGHKHQMNNDAGNGTGNRVIMRRLLSAKDHRVKQLQNQLVDAHNQLAEIARENCLLRSMQKRFDSALQRYESSNGDIPKLLNRHSEEIKLWQAKAKQLKIQLKDTSQRLKNKEAELLQLNDEHKKLLALSKDANLGEREQLQNQVIELTETVIRQNETISVLHRKISLESKNYKHKLNNEVNKHRETRAQLDGTAKYCDRLLEVLEKKDKMLALAAIRSSPKIAKSIRNNNRCDKDNVFTINLPINESSLPDSQGSSNVSAKITETFTIEDPKEDDQISNNFSFNVREEDLAKLATKQNTNNEVVEPHSNLNYSSNEIETHKKDLAKDTQILNTKNISKSLARHHKIRRKNNATKKTKSTTTTNKAENVIAPDISEHLSNLTNENSIEEELPPEDFASMLQLESERPEEPPEELTNEDHELNFINYIIEDYCENVVNSVKTAINGNSSNSNGSPISVVENQQSCAPATNKNARDSEVNNNAPKKRELDEEKKKKLLETLNAIDRGEDDGLGIDSLKKNKFSGKGGSVTNGKKYTTK